MATASCGGECELTGDRVPYDEIAQFCKANPAADVSCLDQGEDGNHEVIIFCDKTHEQVTAALKAQFGTATPECVKNPNGNYLRCPRSEDYSQDVE